MKKIFLLTLVVLLTACGGGDSSSNSSPSNNSPSSSSSSTGESVAMQNSIPVFQDAGFSDIQVTDAFDVSGHPSFSNQTYDEIWCVLFKASFGERKNANVMGLLVRKGNQWEMGGATPVPPDKDPKSYCEQYQ